MKRSSQLSVLSREHHVALELALRLRRASAADADTVRQDALAFWAAEGAEHFRLEEELLLPAFAREVGGDDADIARVLAEHVDIRRRMGDLRQSDVAALNTLGDALHDHVRYEERSFFGRVEEELGEQGLVTLGEALRAAGDAHDPPRA